MKKRNKKREKLNRENKNLRKQLREGRESLDAIEKGNIDGLVMANKSELTILTKTTADKIYRILIEKMHEGAVTLNTDGIILYCNSYFASMVQLSLSSIIGAKFRNFITESLMERFSTLLKKNDSSSINEEVLIYVNDDKTVPVLISANTLSMDGMPVLSIILTDLTNINKKKSEIANRTSELEALNLELENANKDLTAFTYISSHDLQEPLRKIQNFVSCLEQEEEKNLSVLGKKYFARIGLAAKRMQELIEDLLKYSHTRSSERKFEKTDLNVIINEVKIDYEDLIREKKVMIEAANLEEVNIIRFQFRQLLHNLISNSIKFSTAGITAHIIIKTEIVPGNKVNNARYDLPAIGLLAKKDYCHVTYTDNGIGFDPRYKDRIFEVFQRLNSKEAYKGTGIGLAICKRIVENHNGIIMATGELNKGARFDIYIPVSQKKAETGIPNLSL